MKKLLSLFLILVTILCSCSAPAKNEKKEAKEPKEENEEIRYRIFSGSFDCESASGGNIYGTTGYPQTKNFAINQRTYFQNEKAEQKKVVTVDGKRFELTYQDSYAMMMNSSRTCVRDTYKERSATGLIATCELDPINGKIVRFLRFDIEEYAKGDITKEEAEEKALRVVKELHGEDILKTYSIKSTELIDYGSGFRGYAIRYDRSVYGCPAEDYILVKINRLGQLYSVNAKFYGMYEGIEKDITKQELITAYNTLIDSLKTTWRNIYSATVVMDTLGDYYIRVFTLNRGNPIKEGVFYINIKNID